MHHGTPGDRLSSNVILFRDVRSARRGETKENERGRRDGGGVSARLNAPGYVRAGRAAYVRTTSQSTSRIDKIGFPSYVTIVLRQSALATSGPATGWHDPRRRK